MQGYYQLTNILNLHMLYCIVFLKNIFPTLIHPINFIIILQKTTSNEYQVPYNLLHVVSKIQLVLSPPQTLDLNYYRRFK